MAAFGSTAPAFGATSGASTGEKYTEHQFLSFDLQTSVTKLLETTEILAPKLIPLLSSTGTENAVFAGNDLVQ